MDPDDIKLEKISKQFEYYKISSEIDDIESLELLKDIAKSYAKLYLKQQEVLSVIG